MSEENQMISDIKEALDAGVMLAGPRVPLMDKDNRIPFVVVPSGCKVEKIENLLPFPTRKRATVAVTSADSFIEYVKKHGSGDESVIYAQINAEQSQCTMVALMNDNGSGTTNWRDHRCTFSPALSIEWKRWMSKDGHKNAMSQADFATWLEDNQADVRSVDGSPSGADILAMAQAFEVNADKRVKSHINLQSGGVRFEFVDDEIRDTRTSMEVFRRFTLAIPVFDSSYDAYPIPARLKYRDNAGKVTFWYELIRPDLAFKTAVRSVLDKITADTGLLLLEGVPESNSRGS